MKLLVLYEELAWYFVNCMNTFAVKYNCEVLIICKSPNSTAPFNFHYVHPNITIKKREQYDNAQLLEECKRFAPEESFVGGWAYKPYLSVIRELRTSKNVIGFDNHWVGSFKQRLGALYFRYKLKPFFQNAFVPGTPQAAFAGHLGFNPDHIMRGAYCCDHTLFSNYFKNYEAEKAKNFPKRFLFVGRYAPEKGIEDLWSTFIQWQKENPNDWELWCVGKGELTCPTHSRIKHFGFVQPDQMGDIIRQTGVFILSSIFEPWGVVVHEYASAGFPLLCSDAVGAAETFLVDNQNGFQFEAGNQAQLKEKMNIFSTLNQEALLAMSKKSTELASRITPEKWAQNLAKMYGI
jgi:glycosyltransferase involved in cell wall biosynthesis